MDMGIIEARHYELALEIDCLDAFLAASAIRQDVVHFADAGDPSLAEGQSFGPRIRRVIGLNASVAVIDRGRRQSFLSRVRFRMKCRKECDGKRNNGSKESNAILAGIHRDFSSTTPEISKRVSSARFRPSSRPAESYHSCSECAPPPLPPAPIEMASIPKERGMFARGWEGTLVWMKRTEARPGALMGWGMPKSAQLCPPGPVIWASRRRDASAFVVTWSVPEPSSTTTALSFPRYASTMARIPRRFPSPSSPTSATHRTVR